MVETEWVQRELTEEEEAMIDAMVDDAKRAEDEADLAEARCTSSTPSCTS